MIKGDKLMEIFGIIIFIILILIIPIIIYINNKLNYFPNKTFHINLTNKKHMDNNDLLDYYIINYGIESIMEHIGQIHQWEKETVESLKYKPKKINKFYEHYESNKKNAFTFIGYRTQTRYKQINYVRTPYKIDVTSNSFSLSEEDVLKRIQFLKSHNYYVTFNNYNRVDQRKSLTKELKEMIKKRDNYTCQMCGKYMPDEVGLHIDHIIPISMGGKSVPENLQVLCSKCNGKKGKNILDKN